ncbi:hypothetical protein H4219_000346 [Mycoemilia scoparia]|uniref:Succinate-semialdehyde dehydrogenase n=1 Tax=Mycoemilia scoparia TaxID=417184 RepID=A0A9W8DX62_9FUNG|nr:hypothetical protein H4219_000346 [Mycoemilia scoparia]
MPQPFSSSSIPSTLSSLKKLNDASLFHHNACINGKWVESKSSQKFEVHDPATLARIGALPDMNSSDVQSAVSSAKRSFQEWSKFTARKREACLLKWYDLIRENKKDLGRIMTIECGKPTAEAEGEVEYGASFIKWFAEEGIRSYGDYIPAPGANTRHVFMKQPLGVVGIVTPWNFPIAMITRKVGAALAAGNSVVIKPASETPYSALAITELAHRAGIPPGVINVVTTHSNVEEVGTELCTNPDVAKISFTGSTGVGKKLMSLASGTMKRVSFELGGNAPFIVFDDAEIDKAVDGLMASKFRNAGQTCVCANRIYVHQSIHDEFVGKVADRVAQLKVGHGLVEGVNIGPLIYDRALTKVDNLVQDAINKGASVVTGGKSLKDSMVGHFYSPTILTNVKDDMLVAKEEIFGPVCPIFTFHDEQEIIQRANNTRVGLAGYFFSRDIGRIWRVAEGIDVGMVGVNTGAISSEIGPFGGVKESGLGREGSKYGLDEYLNIKWVTLAL